jgi:hypothetical protein
MTGHCERSSSNLPYRGVSVRTGVTHGNAHVISIVYTPRLLLVVLFTYEIVK